MLQSTVLDEFGLIGRYFQWTTQRAETQLSVGDDAALIQPAVGHEIAISTDSLLLGRHFSESVAPEDLGWKALAVNLSDLAAMGADPVAFTLALSLPEIDANWLEAFSEGLRSAACCYGVDLVGGDTTRGALAITITIIGQVAAGSAVRRQGARVGDAIWVSGALGEAALALQMGDLAPNAMRRRLHRPQPRLGQYQQGRSLWRAAIDVSDGFAADLSHVLSASGVGATVSLAELPSSSEFESVSADGELKQSCQLYGGDDYELIVCTEASVNLSAVNEQAQWTRVGVIEAEHGLRARQQDGTVTALTARGWNHFA